MTEEEILLELETMRQKARESENEYDMADSVLHGIEWSRIVLDEVTTGEPPPPTISCVGLMSLIS